uniref:Aldehyde dehydrogenase domain-containing protein n=1 Tax=Sus scrofa TaxID=9823 RepID=A0A8D1P870_PIG
MDPFADTLQRLRETFSSGRTRPAEFRATQLKGLGRFLQENIQLLQEALAQDLHKSTFESQVSEISISQSEINLALRNLRAWMKDEKVSKNLATQLDSAFIRKEPFGLVLIIAPWNYPVNLTLMPLVGALAAGTLCLSTLQSCFAVVLGGPEETGQLLEHKFDHIFFTGEEQAAHGRFWRECRMGEVRGLSPAPPSGVLSPAAGRCLPTFHCPALNLSGLWALALQTEGTEARRADPRRLASRLGPQSSQRRGHWAAGSYSATTF